MTNSLNMRVARAEDAEAITNLINAAFEVERFFLDSDRIDIDPGSDRTQFVRQMLGV